MNNEWQYHLVKGISWLVCRLPYKLILLIGACLGPVYGLIAKKQKLRGINNIKNWHEHERSRGGTIN